MGKLITDTFNEQIRAFFKSGCVKDGLMLMKEMEENMLLSILTSFKKFRSSSQSTYLWARIMRNYPTLKIDCTMKSRELLQTGQWEMDNWNLDRGRCP